MKRVLTAVLLLVALTTTMFAQDAFYIYRNDGQFNAYLTDEVDSIVYSHYDTDSIEHDILASHEIYMSDSLIRIPLSSIDSIVFNKKTDVCLRATPGSIEDWDDAYFYISSKHMNGFLSCFIKEFSNSYWIYMNEKDINNKDNEYVFVFDSNSKLLGFCKNDILYMIDYDMSLLIGVDSLGQIVEQTEYSPQYVPKTSALRTGGKTNALDCLSIIGDVLQIADLADNKEWGMMFQKMGEAIVEKIPIIGNALKLIDFTYMHRKYKLYNWCNPYIADIKGNTDGTKGVTVKIDNAPTLPYEITNVYYYPYSEPIIIKENVEDYYVGISSKKGSNYVSYDNFSERPQFELINKTTEEVTFSLSQMDEMGEEYYIVPYLLTNIQLQDGYLWPEKEMRHGRSVLYVNNDIDVFFRQEQCAYIGNNKVELKYIIEAEIQSLKNVQSWWVTLTDKNDNHLAYAYPSDYKKWAIDESSKVIINTELFDDLGKSTVTLSPLFLYGFNLQEMKREEKSYEITWNIEMITNEATISNENVTLSSSSTGFDMREIPENCKVGFVYGIYSDLSMENSTIVLSDDKKFGFHSVIITNLDKGKYYYRAFVEIEGTYYWGEIKSFTILPVTITGVNTASAQYRPTDHPQHFEYKENPYEFKYNVATNISLTDDTNVENWGYCYEGPENEKTSRISLKGAPYQYEDKRFAYYRNGSPTTHTAKLYPFVKYKDDTEYYYGTPVDYPLVYPVTSNIEVTACSTPEVVTREKVEVNGVTYDYCSTFIVDYDATGAYWIGVVADEYGGGWENWDNNLLTHQPAKAMDGSNRLTINYYYNRKVLDGDYLIRLKGINTHGIDCHSDRYVRLKHDGYTFTGCELKN